MAQFITPFSGAGVLSTSTGLVMQTQGRWLFSQAGFNDGETWGVSLGWPVDSGPSDFYYGPTPTPVQPVQSGELYLAATNWALPGGSALTAYTDPGTGITYGPERCRIQITGRWSVNRRPNPNSFNGQGVIYQSGHTRTDLGDRDMGPVFLLDFQSALATYVIQGSAVEGGAQDTFTGHEFYCRLSQSVTTDNSNREFQSNSTARPIWPYVWSRSWQIS
jgi:hypothetical protein